MEHTSRQVQMAVSEILRTLALPTLESFSSVPNVPPLHSSSSGSQTPGFRGGVQTSEQSSLSLPREERRPGEITRMAMTRENSPEQPGPNETANDVTIAVPMGSLYEVTKLRNLRSNPRGYFQPGITAPLDENDFISRGDVGIDEAEELFEIFDHSLNQYLWGGILLVHKDLLSVRRSSSLLLAAILAVTALHTPNRSSTFNICYSEFFNLVRETMLERYHTLDDIRGLCTAAFWLSDVSC
jgi:hypothetical protein